MDSLNYFATEQERLQYIQDMQNYAINQIEYYANLRPELNNYLTEKSVVLLSLIAVKPELIDAEFVDRMAQVHIREDEDLPYKGLCVFEKNEILLEQKNFDDNVISTQFRTLTHEMMHYTSFVVNNKPEKFSSLDSILEEGATDNLAREIYTSPQFREYCKQYNLNFEIFYNHSSNSYPMERAVTLLLDIIFDGKLYEMHTLGNQNMVDYVKSLADFAKLQDTKVGLGSPDSSGLSAIGSFSGVMGLFASNEILALLLNNLPNREFTEQEKIKLNLSYQDFKDNLLSLTLSLDELIEMMVKSDAVTPDGRDYVTYIFDSYHELLKNNQLDLTQVNQVLDQSKYFNNVSMSKKLINQSNLLENSGLTESSPTANYVYNELFAASQDFKGMQKFLKLSIDEIKERNPKDLGKIEKILKTTARKASGDNAEHYMNLIYNYIFNVDEIGSKYCTQELINYISRESGLGQSDVLKSLNLKDNDKEIETQNPQNEGCDLVK